MANEYLKRQPTSSGNSRRWTLSFWMKNSDPTQGYTAIIGAGKLSPGNVYNEIFYNSSQIGLNLDNASASDNYTITANPLLRDSSSWMHVIVSFTDQGDNANTRIKFYINGAFVDHNTGTGLDVSETSFFNSADYIHYIGSRAQQSAGTTTFDGQYFDVFLVDGQALTPDVFGFYKDGDGYMSSGTINSTDFKPGQWSPRAPKSIKYTINRRGGFGVNGYYLPMNDSSNPGADFHCAPNSIIKLKGEDLPQPQNGAPTTTDAYVSQLRTDPYAANLVYALPLISGGQNSGFGDYSADIKGSGTNKTVSVVTYNSITPTITSGHSPYGSFVDYNSPANTGGYIDVADSTAFDNINLTTAEWTFEGWYKRGAIGSGASNLIQFGNTTDYQNISISLHPSGNIWYIWSYNGSSWGVLSNSGPVIPQDEWCHIAIVKEATPTPRIITYVNGVSVKSVEVTANISYTSPDYMRIGGHYRGTVGGGDTFFYDGGIFDARFYNTVKYKGGFDVPKPYTPVGIEAFRTTADTCKNNFCTMNPLAKGSKYGISDGNLSFTNSTNNWTGFIGATHGFRTGKWYWEVRVNVSSAYHILGIINSEIKPHTIGDAYAYGMTYQSDGRFYAENNGTSSFSTGNTAAQTVGDVMMFAVDMDNKKMWLGINGTWLGSGNPSTGSNENWDSSKGFTDGHYYTPVFLSYSSSGLTANFGQNSSFSGTTTAGTNADDSGKGLFKYAPPTGFLALCEDNLPTPAIADPGEHFKTVLYTGSSVSGSEKGRSVSGLGFKPDLVWLKSRSIVQNHQLYDSVRGFGGGKGLSADEARAEGDIGGYSDSDYGFVSSADDNGFSVLATHSTGSWVNNTGVDYVAWCWKAGGAAVSNTDGSITSQVSANQTAGFSIVSFTMDPSAGTYTVGHGLGKTPKFIITKQRNEPYGWWTQHGSLGSSKYLALNETTAESTLTWGGSPNNSTFTINNSFAIAGTPVIAYCWAEIEGFSKFGSYVGNNSADGPFVYCGFKPAWVMIKATSGTRNWRVNDSSRSSSNPVNKELYPNLSNAEGTFVNQDFLSNGFKLRNNNTQYNSDGVTYIFMAFAESPFQTANAK